MDFNLIIILLLGSIICVNYVFSLGNLSRYGSSSKLNKRFVRGFIFFYSECILILVLSSSIKKDTPSITEDNTDISVRIENISENLSQTSNDLIIIQKELEARVAYIDDLKKEAEIAENVISLSEEQVNAVQAKLNQELEASGNKSLLLNIILSVSFLILGTFSTQLFNLLVSKFKKNTPTNDDAFTFDGYSKEQIEMAINLLRAANKVQNDDVSKSSE